MNAQTRQRLNQINQDFYRTTADAFDQTRGHPWPGWERMWEIIQPEVAERDELSVLDVGCGNGRLGLFLADQLAALQPAVPLLYHGQDTDETLLARAEEALNEHILRSPSLPAGRGSGGGVQFKLEQRDIITHPPNTGAYDLVALFGVMHHIPGYRLRQTFLQILADLVTPGGWLVFACWRFMDYERFRRRVVPWPDDLVEEVEANDHLLDWRQGERALRYCHHVDDAEHAALLAAGEETGLSVVSTYRADGRPGDANLYAILRKERDARLG